MRTKIYTKGGDYGQTSVIGGPRVSKSNIRLEAYGTIDEVNACVGMAIGELESALSMSDKLVELSQMLSEVQNHLFVIGSQLACVDEKFRDHLPALDMQRTQRLENHIDQMTNILPELKDFILPGGHKASSCLHLARTICRRAERCAVLLFSQTVEIEKPTRDQIIVYMNRLSDYLFVSARFVNFITHTSEVKWKK